jgi:hypothetical protein
MVKVKPYNEVPCVIIKIEDKFDQSTTIMNIDLSKAARHGCLIAILD